MALTEPADAYFQARTRESESYRAVAIAGTGELMLNGEHDIARHLLGDIVKGAFGLELVAEAAGINRRLVEQALDAANPVDPGLLLVILEATRKLAKVSLEVRSRPDETGHDAAPAAAE